MGALDTATTNKIIDHLLLTAAYTPTGPLKLRLMTANGTKGSNGVEATGGSYAAQTITFNAASGESASSAADVLFTDMGAVTIVGAEIWDSAGTPKRIAWGALTASRTLLAGDDLKFPAGSVILTLNAD